MKALIIEDEMPARQRLINKLKTLDRNIIIQDELDSIEDSINWLHANNPPDVIFLDIHLADGNAFEIFSHCQVKSPVIFTTAYDKYAIDAFRNHAIDYLLKPIKNDELAEALDKIQRKNITGQNLYDSLDSILNKEKERRFLIKMGTKYNLVEPKDIAYFFTSNKIVFLQRIDGKKFPVDLTLDQLALQLNSNKFFRINRQVIIHLQSIREMHTATKSRVSLYLDPPLSDNFIVSTEKSPLFKKWVQGI